MDRLVGKHGMFLVFIKFVEIATRAAFVVGTAYSLKLSGAGQFGVVVTLVGLFAFAFNWERQVDIQRRYVDEPAALFDRAVMAALPFWGFNQLLMLPVFVVLCAWITHLTPWQLLLAAIVVSGEHVANQTYQMALISRRYWGFLIIVAGKNIAVLAAVLPYVLLAPSKLTLDYVLLVWAVGQAACAVAVFAMLWRIKQDAPHDAPFSWRGRVFAQHRASFTHFQIGAVAILMLQYDRLIVGTLLPLAEVGVYYRHILIVSFAYQFFNVASCNRVMPRIYAAARRGDMASVHHAIRRELTMVFAVVIGAFLTGWAIDEISGRAITSHYHLSMLLAGVLLAGALVRITADFIGMVANARMREDIVLRQQLTAFMAGGALLAALTWRFGVMGTAAASAAASALYLILIQRGVRGVAPPEASAVAP